MSSRNIALIVITVGICMFGADESSLLHASVVSDDTASASWPRAATDSEEVALGAALARQFDTDRGIVASPESDAIEAHLQAIADSLGRHAHRDFRWKIHYDPHPGIKSGFALPGGHIVIWGGILAYMSTDDEAAAIIAHEIEHIDDGQVSRRIDSLIASQHRDVRTPQQWTWDEFGTSYGDRLEYLCDYKGAKLAVETGYSPYGFKTLLESFVALGKVHAPSTRAPKAIVDRIGQIEREIAAEHWEALRTTHPVRLPGSGD